MCSRRAVLLGAATVPFAILFPQLDPERIELEGLAALIKTPWKEHLGEIWGKLEPLAQGWVEGYNHREVRREVYSILRPWCCTPKQVLSEADLRVSAHWLFFRSAVCFMLEDLCS